MIYRLTRLLANFHLDTGLKMSFCSLETILPGRGSNSRPTVCGSREFDPRPGQYSRMSFSSDPGDWYGFLI